VKYVLQCSRVKRTKRVLMLGLETSWEQTCFNRTSGRMMRNSHTEVDFENSVELTADMIKVWAFKASTIS